jgi:hypothetical protein
MKKILLILSLFPILVFSQKSYKIPADSTILNNIGSGKNELVIRNATSNITGGVLTNLGNGITAFVLGGNTGRYVDTIYKNTASDSIIYKIQGIRYAILDKDNNTSTFTFAKNATKDSIIATHDGVRSAVKDSISVTDLSGYVPYIGATGDVNIGLHKYIGTALQSNISAGVSILNNTASPIGLFGAGGGINSTFYGAVKLDGGTANRILSLDASKNIQYTVIQKVDSSYLFKNATRDSICMITIINGNTYRSCAFDSVGGGGGVASLSGLTAATATNNIQNTNYKQRWNWNTLAGDTAMVIASNSKGAASNLQNLLTISQSGANATSSQTTYGAIFSNKKTGTSSTNIAGRFIASGATNNYAIEAENQVKILNASTGPRYLSFWSGTTENARIGNLNGFGALASDNLDIENLSSGMSIVFRNNGSEKARIRSSGALCLGTTGDDLAALYIAGGSFNNAMYVTDGKSILLNGAAGGTYKTGVNTNLGADGSDNMFLQVAGGTKMIIANSYGVSIGANTTPASSAILDVVSTTKGFLPPRMTATQASAIATPAQGLMLFVTNTNGTFTSVGWWGYNGSTWEKLNN